MNKLAWLRRFNTLLNRILAVLLLAIFLAQGLSGFLWLTQLQNSQRETIVAMAEQLAFSMASTARFFSSLPVDYRHIVLDQLRRMGGSRFFVSFNTEYIEIRSTESSALKLALLQQIDTVIRRELGSQTSISSRLTVARNLHVFNKDIALLDLPPGWGHHSLLLDPDRTPILVVQIQTDASGWLYIATHIPTATGTLEQEALTGERLLFLGLTVLLITLAAFMIVKSFLRPLKLIAVAADQLGRDIEHPPLPETGSQEMISAARSFNAMRARIKRYTNDRDHLFSAISHDLKTPITRLRLRTELLEDEQTKEKFCRDLADLEELAHGALQSIRETTLHENSVELDIPGLLARMAEPANLGKTRVSLDCQTTQTFTGKPLALKRALGNILDNALFYGGRADVRVIDSKEQLTITVRDYGPGIPPHLHERVFEPYVRLEGSRNRNTGGAGLGLGISRNIVRGHGGNLTLANHPKKGLLVTIVLPRT
jgi:signal transduction histidine kinase